MEVKKSWVLIVDDVRNNVEFISDIVSGLEHTEVKGLTSGREALDFVRENKPDLILLDISMPEMDGFEVCRRLKSDPETSGIPVIFLTARTQKDDIIKGFELGAVDYIAKPFHVAELQSRIQTHLELRQKTRELQEINLHLEDMVQHRTRQLNETNKKLTRTNRKLKNAYEELKSLDEAKNDFITHINHELRTPLNGIVGYTTLLEEARLDKESRSHLKSINSLVSRLIRVAEISLLLTELKTSNYRVRLNSVNLNEVIRDALLRDDLETKNLQVQLHHPEEPLHVLAESRLLSICLSLVLDNAIKYSPENGTIDIYADIQQHTAALKICDQGPGFSSAAKSNLFELFTADNLEYRKHGFGIGLATVKRIMDLMNGSISVQNHQQGATVILTLPVSESS